LGEKKRVAPIRKKIRGEKDGFTSRQMGFHHSLNETNEGQDRDNVLGEDEHVEQRLNQSIRPRPARGRNSMTKGQGSGGKMLRGRRGRKNECGEATRY